MEHQLDHGQLDERLRRQDALLPVLVQPPTSAQPRERPLVRPPDRQKHPALGALRPPHEGQIPPAVLLDPLAEPEVMVFRVGNQSGLQIS